MGSASVPGLFSASGLGSKNRPDSLRAIDCHFTRTSTDEIRVIDLVQTVQESVILVMWEYARKDGVKVCEQGEKRAGDLPR